MSEAKSRANKPGRNDKPRLNLVGFEQGDERPEMRVYAVDRSFKPLASAQVDENGGFDLSADVLKKAHQVVIGPDRENLDDVDRENLLIYRSAQFSELLAGNAQINISRQFWLYWHFVYRCVSGHVSRCYPYPWFIRDLVLQANSVQRASVAKTGEARLLSAKASAASNWQIAKPAKFLPLHQRCDVVCNGIVEVYRRTCCCKPWIIDDFRLPDLLDELDGLIPRIPDIPWPPRPEPDPLPFRNTPIFKEGALDEFALNAKRDLTALRSLSQPQALEYIQARPYLFCRNSCGTPKKVAQGFINPDGKFNICWSELLTFLTSNCHYEYAYVVKQQINGVWITIYNGMAANIWFHYGDNASLVSYHPKARSCRRNDFPGDGAFALLQDVGDAHSYRLKTPNATAWNAVGAAAYNDGLADPALNPADALGQLKDRNWGGTLKLLYHFSEDMKDIGARYYRISARRTNATGQPIGAPTYFSDGLVWKKFSGGGDVEPVVMGPFSQGGQDNLYSIAYDADADWLDNQYHGFIDTTDFSEGRYLLTLEVFNGAGQCLRPTGTLNPASLDPSLPGSLEAGFTFRRWYQEFGPTAAVPHAALTHMFWWDNREAVGQIVDLRKNGSPSETQCQFLEDGAAATFSVGYRAYHPENMFLLNHSLWWRRGLGGPTGYLVNSSPLNVGYPPAGPVGVSPTHTFEQMLDNSPIPPNSPLTKCSFALNLYLNVKTFNGEGTLNGLDDWDYAAFALEIS